MGLKETNLTRRIEQHIKKRGALIVKYAAGPLTLQGFPDTFGCYKGRFFAIEIKIHPAKPKPNQHEWIKRISEWYDGYSFWVDDTNWKEKIDEMLDDIERSLK